MAGPPVDIVDELQQAWKLERPDVDVSWIGVVGRVIGVARRLTLYRDRVLTEAGLDFPTLDIVTTLRRAGSPYVLPVGELQRASLVTAGAISQRLDRVEAAGLVRRYLDKDDRRRVYVGLTPDGAAVADRGLELLQEREAPLLRIFSRAEAQTLERLLKRWLLALDDLQGPIAVHPPRRAAPPNLDPPQR
jgi:DNA-binding MarR family transcriptional regulator